VHDNIEFIKCSSDDKILSDMYLQLHIVSKRDCLVIQNQYSHLPHLLGQGQPHR